MARSIVLRFDATCHDCGRTLSAGTTARWFGKGRVSCCGSPTSPDQARADRALGDHNAIVPDPVVTTMPVRPMPAPASPRFGNATIDGELSNAVRAGLNAQQLARLAEVAPLQALCIRLTSGARFTILARDAVHVIACIEESCRDHVRDVMGAAQ